MSRLLLLLSLSVPLFADHIILKNGDTLTGSIIKKDGAKLTIKSEILGEVSMPWAAIQSVTSDEPVTVEVPGAQPVVGKLTTSGDTLQIATASAVQSTPFATVGNIRNPAEQHSWERLQHPKLTELWTGFFDVGLALARGNARTDTLTSAFTATRVTRKDKVTINFNTIYGTARLDQTTKAIANAVHGGWTYNRDLNPRIFVSTLNTYERDQFQSLDLRFVAGAGFGLNAIKTDKTALSFAAAVDYSRENFQQSFHRNSAEANFGNDLLYKFSPVTSVTESFRIFPNLTDTGEYRINMDVSAVTALKRWLGWHVTASDHFLTNPVFGLQRNDLIISTGLRMSFSR